MLPIGVLYGVLLRYESMMRDLDMCGWVDIILTNKILNFEIMIKMDPPSFIATDWKSSTTLLQPILCKGRSQKSLLSCAKDLHVGGSYKLVNFILLQAEWVEEFIEIWLKKIFTHLFTDSNCVQLILKFHIGCCIFWPAFGCCTPQTLVKVCVYNIFCVKI